MLTFENSQDAKKSRDLFSTQTTNFPGPGIYEAEGHTANSFNNTGQSPMFLSKVPNCKDTKDDNGIPGPGSYLEKSKKNKNKALHQRSNSYRVEPNGRGFMTGTKREGYWDNNLDAPFTKATNISESVGPAKYHNLKKKGAQSEKNESHHDKVGFHSSDARYWLKKNSKAGAPGPGQYIDMSSTHFLANKNSQKYNSEHLPSSKNPGGKTSHFTSKSIRFTGGFFTAKEGPGPGDYEHVPKSADSELKAILTKAQINNKGKGGSVFRSTTNRFVESEPQNPSVRILDKKPDNYSDLIIYNMKGQNKNNNQYQGMIHPNKKVGFTATSPRFTHNQLFYGEKLKYTPGPGDYQGGALRPKSYSHSRGVGRKQAFSNYIQPKGTNQVVGPGSYISTECTMIKKSYNMSLE